jgi:ubiquinone/menaquinone biosynthesis C-methylase UbiE
MAEDGALALPGVHGSPNIQGAPDVYEVENEAFDPEQRVEAAMRAVLPWDGRVVLDVGAGTGFHVPRFHAAAAHVVAVEPHGPSRVRAMARVGRLGLERASVTTGSAERLLLPDASVDVVHARFAYFFGPGCERGLAEVARVLRPGGAAFLLVADWRTSTFTSWLRRSRWAQAPDPAAVEAFWARHGFGVTRVATEYRCRSRADFEAVVRIEFPPELADVLLAEHPGTAVDAACCLYHHRY